MKGKIGRVDNLTATYPESYQGREAEYERLVLANERIGVKEYQVRAAAHGLLGCCDTDEILLNYAKARDPLAIKLTHPMIGYRNCDGLTEVAAKFVLRKFTEEEYNGYLNSELPIGKTRDTGVEVYVL